MIEFLISLCSACWLGVLTSISPCPLATNITAISYIGRRVDSPWKVLATGLLYTAGRMLTYLVLGILITASLLSAPTVSHLLQKYMNKLLGPLLIVIGMMLLELIRVKLSGSGVSEKMQKRVDALGMWGGLMLGAVFAASMCPISGALFFGSLLSIAVRVKSVIFVPAVFGMGTALPVVAFAVLIAVSAKSLSRAFDKVKAFERWARRITGVIFILVGIYFCLAHIFGLFA